MKGRIIGREGRNIRAFEKATGVDLIIDDTPGVVIVSGFDMIRREVARLALNKLIADGRIHPARIEEIVVATQKELEKHIQKLGEDACQELAIHGLHERLINLLGRLHFRTSYSQNVLRHCVEVAFIAGMMAEEVGLDGALARRCGLLHDIGKAADHEAEGGHPKIGADLLKRYGERPEVVHAACGHHDDLRICNPYTVLVAAADACSAARPGARRESLERYVKRMEELERIAGGFTGVEQAYAIQAGRELRVLVNSKETTDEVAAKICHDIVQAFEKQLTYPGEIKVTVVRESRHVEVTNQCEVNTIVSMLVCLDCHSIRIRTCDLLFIGDIVGKPGRQICTQALRGLRQEQAIDLIVANAENASGGSGLTPPIYRELLAAGIDGITLGDHVYKRREIIPILQNEHAHRPSGQLSGRGPGPGSDDPDRGEPGSRGRLHALGPGLHAAGRLPVSCGRSRAGRAARATSA